MQPLSSTLISTKITRPVLHSRLVHRIRLIDRLRAGMNHRLTCLIAPAGFGKTTMVKLLMRFCAVNSGAILVEQGKHAKLLAKKGFYAELYNSQFEGKEI